jgi:hypothetical protein
LGLAAAAAVAASPGGGGTDGAGGVDGGGGGPVAEGAQYNSVYGTSSYSLPYNFPAAAGPGPGPVAEGTEEPGGSGNTASPAVYGYGAGAGALCEAAEHGNGNAYGSSTNHHAPVHPMQRHPVQYGTSNPAYQPSPASRCSTAVVVEEEAEWRGVPEGLEGVVESEGVEVVDNGWGPDFCTHRIDIDEGGGEVIQLVLTDPADPGATRAGGCRHHHYMACCIPPEGSPIAP